MASPDPIAAERAHYLALLGLTVDDPAVTLSQLRAMTGAGVDARSAAEAKITEQKMVAGSAFVRSVNGINPDVNGNVTVSGGGGGGGSELSGTGSPEGVVTASPGTYYTDTNGTNGAWRWIKTAGTGNTGWVCVEGDTGLRDLRSFINAPATANTFQACRSGRVTYLTIFVSFSSTAWTPGDVLFTLPDGFRPAASHYVSPPYAGPGALSVEPSGSAILWSGNVSTVTAWSFAYVTPAAWPSTLPGTPA